MRGPRKRLLSRTVTSASSPSGHSEPDGRSRPRPAVWPEPPAIAKQGCVPKWGMRPWLIASFEARDVEHYDASRCEPPAPLLPPGLHRLVAPSGSADRITTCPRRSDKEKPSNLEGFQAKRLKGLEPSTFCMAIGMTSAGIWLIYLQIRWFCRLITPSEWLRMRGDWAQSARVSGTNPERSDRVASGSGASISGRGETDPAA
jgi:hypothetical protein